jgi:hypothetical protein
MEKEAQHIQQVNAFFINLIGKLICQICGSML